MSWQRIDENTYIDDTLVTCAEYQLFIDEMREQGKYYQPDHWTSYQFPKGHAHKPILGVRSEDVGTFCEWLTVRESKEFQYRMPNEVEVLGKPLLGAPDMSAHGYWLAEKEKEPQFEWAHGVFKDARQLVTDNLIKNVQAIEYERLLRYVYDRGEDDGELTFDYKKVPELLAKLISVLGSVIEGSGSRPLYVNRKINRFVSRKPNTDKYFKRDFIYTHDEFCENLNEIFYRTIAEIIFVYLVINHPLMNAVVVLSRYTPIFRSSNPDQVINDYLNHLVNIHTLQERIAGRSPAFEGIRLVKERIK
jgi:hypothetical protein